MNGIYFLIFLLPFSNCKTFHQNQHLPLQTQQPPLRYMTPYQPLYQQPYQRPSYPAFYPAFYPQPAKQGNLGSTNGAGSDMDIDRQYQQQWQIAIPNQQQGGVVWISAPQYGYYPPPPNGNYPPPGPAPGYPSYPYPPSPPPAAGPSPGSSTVEQQNPSTVLRDTDVPSTGSGFPSSTPTPEPSQPTDPSNPPFTIEPSSQSPWTSESTTNWSPSSTSSSSEATSQASSGSSSSWPSTTSRPSSTLKPENSTQPSNSSSNPLLKYCKKPRGQFPAEDCRKFINCWDDFAIEQTCPNNLAFNPEREYCDYPENVNCTLSNNSSESSGGSPSNSTSSSNSTLVNPKCPSSYGTYRNSSNCAAFYVCVSGEPVDFICPPGTAYNDELKVCDYPYRVDCKGSPNIPASEESSTDVVTETPESPWNATSSASTSTIPPIELSSGSSSTSQKPSSTYSVTETASSSESQTPTSQLPAVASSEEPIPPPGVDPIGFYNYNLKKIPESIVNTGVRCYHSNVFRLTPDCSSVTVCQDGLTYIVNCGHATSFDAYSNKCIPSFRARC